MRSPCGLIENVIQIIMRMLNGGHSNGVNHERKQAVTWEYRPRYQKATKREKLTLLDEFTRLTGYHRKSTVRLLSAKLVREVLVNVNRKPVTLKQEKKQPANREGKRVYTHEVIAFLRLICTLIHRGNSLLPSWGQQMPFITQTIRDNLMNINPASINRSFKKTRPYSPCRIKLSPNRHSPELPKSVKHPTLSQ
jgi:hypothetical protein